MEIAIQAYWDAKVKSINNKTKITAEEYLKENPEIHICDIVIDAEVVGTVAWDGKKLSIFERVKKSPLDALRETNKRNK